MAARPFYVSTTRSREQVQLQAGSRLIQFLSGPTVELPEATLQGQELVAADVTLPGGRPDVWVVVTGVANDRGYLVKRNDLSILRLGTDQVHGRYPAWVLEYGDVNWVQRDAPYTLHHLDGRETETRDTHNPYAPNESAVEDWGGGIRVCNVHHHGPWDSATWADDGPGEATTLLRKDGQGSVLVAGTFTTQIPPHCTSHDDGTATVNIQVPAGYDYPVAIHSSACKVFVPPVRVPTFPECTHLMAETFSDDPEEAAFDFGYATLQDRTGAHSGTSWQQAIEYASFHGVPCVAYSDSLTFDEPLYREFLKLVPRGMRVIPQQAFYLSISKAGVLQDTLATATARFRREAARMRDMDPANWSINGQAYRMYGGATIGYPVPLQLLLDLQLVIFNLALEFKCRWLRWYTWRRPWQLDRPIVDGVLKWAETLKAATRMKAAVPTRAMYPRQPDLPQVPPVVPPTGPGPGPVEPPKPPTTVTPEEELVMGAIVIIRKRLVKNDRGPFPDRYHEVSPDGKWMASVNSNGERTAVPATQEPGANESIIWVEGEKVCKYQPSPQPFDNYIFCIVSEG